VTGLQYCTCWRRISLLFDNVTGSLCLGWEGTVTPSPPCSFPCLPAISWTYFHLHNPPTLPLLPSLLLAFLTACMPAHLRRWAAMPSGAACSYCLLSARPLFIFPPGSAASKTSSCIWEGGRRRGRGKRDRAGRRASGKNRAPSSVHSFCLQPPSLDEHFCNGGRCSSLFSTWCGQRKSVWDAIHLALHYTVRTSPATALFPSSGRTVLQRSRASISATDCCCWRRIPAGMKSRVQRGVRIMCTYK